MPTQAARRRAKAKAKAKAAARLEPDSEPDPENPTPEISNCDSPGCESPYLGRLMECCNKHLCFSCAWQRLSICICNPAVGFFMTCPFCGNHVIIEDDLMKTIMARECPEHHMMVTNVCGLEEEIPLRLVHCPGYDGYECGTAYFTVYMNDVQIRGHYEP